MKNRFDTVASILGVVGLVGAAIVFGVVSYSAPDPNQIYDPVRAGDPLP